MYSPGKALVVYEMRRHVCDCGQNPAFFLTCARSTHLSDSTVTCDNTLDVDISDHLFRISLDHLPRTLSDCVAGAAIVTVRVYPISEGSIFGEGARFGEWNASLEGKRSV